MECFTEFSNSLTNRKFKFNICAEVLRDEESFNEAINKWSSNIYLMPVGE